MDGIRQMNIGIAVAIAFVIAAVLIFKNSSEAAMQAMAMIGMFVGLAVGQGLHTRAKRQKRNRPQ
jgi:uncharacterized membrane protein